jgi:hypothetical protein
VPLFSVPAHVDVASLVHVGFEFGSKVGNTRGTVIYVDDVALTRTPSVVGNGPDIPMPAVFPQHWPFGSVAGTAWLIFVELDINPFASPAMSASGR